jgi:hypothetical protein
MSRYRDLVLGTLASIATLWSVTLLFIGDSEFDTRLTIGFALLAAILCLLSPNRKVLVGMVLGVVAVQGWFAILFSRDKRAWIIAVSASLLAALFFRLFGNDPVVDR